MAPMTEEDYRDGKKPPHWGWYALWGVALVVTAGCFIILLFAATGEGLFQ